MSGLFTSALYVITSSVSLLTVRRLATNRIYLQRTHENSSELISRLMVISSPTPFKLFLLLTTQLNNCYVMFLTDVLSEHR